VGWLGRVHRGTPWQTIYLKAPVTEINKWRKWSGGAYFARNVGQLSTNVVPYNTLFPDSDLSQPWRDRYIIDLFTTAVNENATRGQLSVNQTNLAAWSAVLSGVPVLTNVYNEASFNNDPFLRPRYAGQFIPPAGVYRPGETNPAALPGLVRIVDGINATRATNAFTQPFKLFRRVGEILATPELTVASPFLNTNSTVLVQRGINDAAYERIPQQILGLLKADPTPRFVIYSYGQALKPADRSLVSSGRFFQLCTNYQVTAEMATRAVVRVDGVPPYPPPLSPAPALTNLNVVVESFNVLPPE
jgi:hypothetical protein